MAGSSWSRRAARLIRRAGAPVGSIDAVRGVSEIVMTFDDGPDPVGTPAVLRALAAHDATATFFMLLTRARRHPDLVAAVRSEGHEIALHGLDHRRLTHFSYAQVLARTRSARSELEVLGDGPVDFFRPPDGVLTPAAWLAVRRAGLSPVMWGPTTWDWRDVSQDDRVTKAQQGARGGAVVLAHDAFADASDGAEWDDPATRAPVLDRFDLIDRVLAAYADRGLRARSLGDALAHGSPLRAAHFHR